MKTYDLNLLRTLDALLSAGSVTGAAERLHLSVPATSHALARLRELTATRCWCALAGAWCPRRVPWACANPWRSGLHRPRCLCRRRGGTTWRAASASFVVRAPDGFAIAFGGALGTALAAAMPRAQLSFVTETHDDAGALRDGRVDLDIGPFRPREPEIEVVDLFPQALIAVVRAGHPFAARPATARRYAAQAHVTCSGVPGRHRQSTTRWPRWAWRGASCSPWRTPARRPSSPHGATSSPPSASDWRAPWRPASASRWCRCRSCRAARRWSWRGIPRHAADPAHGWLRRQVRSAIVAAKGHPGG
jgi:DNA-binding transcriptional LysR family regulator